ncbi:MAG: histidinol dehydrogenase [Spirochaetaceae bacterium 4572_59]|nr:MAG: histidinol dehydrogenase [Spirochaetaceae bacterium 4572_59]
MKINKYSWEKMTRSEKEQVFSRSELNISAVSDTVNNIINEVRNEGDAALLKFNNQFDKTPLDMSLRVSDEEFDEAEKHISDDVRDALIYSIENVRRFHNAQKPESMNMMEVRPGVLVGEKASPIESVGLYVPRGRGNFPSMLYMLALPAVVAEVPRICIVTPPDEKGKVDPACLVAARLCGITEIYKIGGAHAIAALAYGTETIKPVVKMNGPGSMYVTAAKRLVAGRVDIGMPAGPSESMVWADSNANPEKVALDLMIEAEHGSDSSALLVTECSQLADSVEKKIIQLTKDLGEPRKTFVTDVMKGYGGIILCESMEQSAKVINRFAPEHLQIQTTDPFESLPYIKNAGEILLGDNTPFSIANYSVGANAVLPTGGNAKTYSAISVRDFIKYSSVVYVSADGLEEMKPHVISLADYEGFETHGDALKKRRS